MHINDEDGVGADRCTEVLSVPVYVNIEKQLYRSEEQRKITGPSTCFDSGVLDEGGDLQTSPRHVEDGADMTVMSHVATRAEQPEKHKGTRNERPTQMCFLLVEKSSYMLKEVLNSLGISKTAIVIVFVLLFQFSAADPSPWNDDVLIDDSSPTKIHELCDLRLPCTTYGSSLTWQFNGTKMSEANMNYSIQLITNTSTGLVTSVLTVPNVSAACDGTYSCYRDNGNGFQHPVTILKRKCKPIGVPDTMNEVAHCDYTEVRCLWNTGTWTIPCKTTPTHADYGSCPNKNGGYNATSRLTYSITIIVIAFIVTILSFQQ